MKDKMLKKASIASLPTMDVDRLANFARLPLGLVQINIYNCCARTLVFFKESDKKGLKWNHIKK